ncbi:MAG: tetratricopeptide repeat protein [Gemmatimonadaceae bacterium]
MGDVLLSVNGFWKDTNAEGLGLAKEGRWAEATRAFEDALAQLSAEVEQHGVTLVAHDDARAQLLLNLGQSYFHTGNLDDARRFAERSCAIRVSLYGEDALVVARTRGDLAVILGASGHPDEAIVLLERAVTAVEKKRGAHSAHLVPLLTNAARLLERSSPELARPFVSRLNALLFAQKLADEAASITPTEVPSHSFANSSDATASDDHYLRSAIAETMDLLRTTPPANIAIATDADSKDEPVEDTIFDLVEAPPPTLNAVPDSTANAPISPLGFEVQYGIPVQWHEPLVDPAPMPALLTDPPAAPTPSGQLTQPLTNRSGVRAVGGVRRGSTQVVAPMRLWYIGVAIVAFGAGIGLTYIIMPLLR